MDPNAITPENLVVVASFIVPGYFAIRSYGAVHTKVDRDFSKLLIESIAFSLPIVGLYNATLRHIFRVHIVYPTSVKYFLPLLLCSLLLGYLVGQFRKLHWVEALAQNLGLPGPNDDFMASQFSKLASGTYVTITLKDGEIFSGVRRGISKYTTGTPQLCHFSDLAWYDKKKGRWEDRPGSLIVSLAEVEYIETESPLPKS